MQEKDNAFVCKNREYFMNNLTLKWLRKRELGSLSYQDTICCRKNLYSNITAVNTWDPSKSIEDTDHGGIFNFDFSPDGSILAAACERKSILIFDPLNGKLVTKRFQAHRDCVNCVKFLDTRVLATCSDDTTIALWDIRHFKHQLRTLRGHSSWVKNIEYCAKKDLLVSSGFDGFIYTWDINRYSEETSGQKVFQYKPLMRSKMSPDGTKLYISTEHGLIFMINNVDFATLGDDHDTFSPYRFHRMVERQMVHNRLNPERNKVELIRDWPIGNDAHVIASLQVHPQGWCILSRNTSSGKESEWTCVHDVQDRREEEYEESSQTSRSSSNQRESRNVEEVMDHSSPPHSSHSHPSASVFSLPLASPPRRFARLRESLSNVQSLDSFLMRRMNHHDNDNVDETEQENPSGRTNSAARGSIGNGFSAIGNGFHDVGNGGHMFLDWIGSEDDHNSDENMSNESNSDSEMGREQENGSIIVNDTEARQALSDILTLVFGTGEQQHTFRFSYSDRQRALRDNSTNKYPSCKRLLAFAEEANVGQGFIKELCFNADGRLIGSPFGFGVRLLAFDSACSELCDVVPESPVKLYELGSCISHTNNVVTCKFSPVHCLLVSGCLDGRIVFHQPRL